MANAVVRGEAHGGMPSTPHQSHGEQREAPRTIILSLPLPSPLLTPNVRMHWAERARHTSHQRETARWMTRKQCDPDGIGFVPYFQGRVRIDIEVRPRPRMKQLDDDNFWASMKATRDGIAATGMVDDDKQFVSGTLTWSTERSGLLVVTLTEARAEAAPGAGGGA